MIDRYAINSSKTFSGVLLLGTEPKLQRSDKKDPKSPMEHAKDKDGVLKWTVTLAVQVKSFDSMKFETIPVTILSANRPYGAMAPGSPVTIEGLELGILPKTGGGFSVFYSAEAIRPLQPARVAPGQ